MLIKRIEIQNYKSLRSVVFVPDPLSVIVGANGAGKSNFADAIDFLADVYRSDLSVAVQNKGGYENIAFRRQRRTKAPITLSLTVDITGDDITDLDNTHERVHWPLLRFHHSFEFVTSASSIRADFKIKREEYTAHQYKEGHWNQLVTLKRVDDQCTVELNQEKVGHSDAPMRIRPVLDAIVDYSRLQSYGNALDGLDPTELMVNSIGRSVFGIRYFNLIMRELRVFQINPARSRETGVPAPKPELERLGSNLPAVIDSISKNDPQAWETIMSTMRGIMPELKSIEVDYTFSQRLALFFREEGSSRPWGVEQVSDGTIKTLALLVAIFDRHTSALVLEEPENSIHPWLIRRVLDACREAAKTKQIILTTHSPIVIDSVRPEDVWVMWREKGESRLELLSELDTDFLPMWEQGEISTFGYLDSGAQREALPPIPSVESILAQFSAGE